jgi:hypothetical protein
MPFFLDFITEAGLVSNNLHLHKFSHSGFSGAYINWFCGDLTNRQSQVYISEILSLSVEILKDLFGGLFFSTCLLIIFNS